MKKIIKWLINVIIFGIITGVFFGSARSMIEWNEKLVFDKTIISLAVFLVDVFFLLVYISIKLMDTDIWLDIDLD